MLVSLATFDLRPAPHSPLVDAAASALAGPRGFEIPKPLTALSSSPPPRRGGVSYLRERDGAVDIGATAFAQELSRSLRHRAKQQFGLENLSGALAPRPRPKASAKNHVLREFV